MHLVNCCHSSRSCNVPTASVRSLRIPIAMPANHGKGKQPMPPPHPFFKPKTIAGPSTSRSIAFTPIPRVTQHSAAPVQPSSSPEPEVPGSRKISWIWDHGHIISGGWQCIYCSQRYSGKTTSNQQRHLWEIHQILRPDASKSEHKTQKCLLASGKVESVRLRELLATWLVERRHPFIEVESQAFRNFVEYLNPLALDKLPKPGNTCHADIMECFQQAKSTVKESLQSARSKIRLSFELWTSSNYKAILAIIGHWTNSEYKVETATLGIREILAERKGEDLSSVVL
jgi:hypothetical protein